MYASVIIRVSDLNIERSYYSSSLTHPMVSESPICSICIDPIKESQLSYTLSCNHVFHFTCFKKYVYQSKGTFFTECPNCKQVNRTIEIPYEDGYKNLVSLCCSQVGKERCLCHTKRGTRCKKKSYPLNYGKCHIHNQDILPRDKCELLFRYIYHIMQSDLRTWTTKVYLIDVAKKLAVKYPDIQTLDDIYRYLFVYIADAKHRGIQHYYQDRNALYTYYELEPPPENWVQFCCDKHVLF